MLILTKEEINNKIDCFRKLIGLYNSKIEFLQKLLLYFQKNGQTIDCIVLNICVKGVAEDIFANDDHIQIQSQEINFNEIISSTSQSSSQYKETIQTQERNTNDMSNLLSSSSLLSKEIPTSSGDITFKNVVLLPLESKKNDIGHINSLSYNSTIANNTQQTLMMITPKSEPSVTKLINHMNNFHSNSSLASQQINSIALTSDLRRQNPVKLKKSGTNPEILEQSINKNIFLSNNSIDDINKINLSIKNETSNNSKFTTPKSLKLKQFKCEFCASAFAQKGVLNRHKFLRHSPTVIKPHICPKCQKGFTLKHHLKNHLKCKSGCRYFS